MKFRPCIDIHENKVKQIIGSTLHHADNKIVTNFETDKSPAWYAEMYKNDGLYGGHIIMLGTNNEDACIKALTAFPNGMHVGGGITLDNADFYLKMGAQKIIITSALFTNNKLDFDKAMMFSDYIGKENIVIDLSCRKKDNKYFVVSNQWKTFTDTEVTPESLKTLSKYCSEFLIHGVDVEGKSSGIEKELISTISSSPIPTVYAGGINSINDIKVINEISNGQVDFTVGSALDIFGGNKLLYKDLVKYN